MCSDETGDIRCEIRVVLFPVSLGDIFLISFGDDGVEVGEGVVNVGDGLCVQLLEADLRFPGEFFPGASVVVANVL